LSSAKNKKNSDWLLADKAGFSLFLIGRKPESGKVHGSFPRALRSWIEIGRKQRAGKLKRKKESR